MALGEDQTHEHARIGPRGALAALNDQISTAQRERARALEEHDRHAVLGDKLQERVAAHQDELRRMVEPALDAAVYADHLFRANRLAQEIEALTPLVDQDALRAARDALAAANATLSALTVEQQRQLQAVVLEAVGSFISQHLMEVWARATRLSAVIEAFARHYEGGGDPNLAHRLRRVAVDALDLLRVTADPPGAAQRFLDELAHNPAAEIEAPAGETVYQLVPVRSMADPLPDGSVHLNRGPAQEAPDVAGMPNPAQTDAAAVAGG